MVHLTVISPSFPGILRKNKLDDEMQTHIHPAVNGFLISFFSKINHLRIKSTFTISKDQFSSQLMCWCDIQQFTIDVLV